MVEGDEGRAVEELLAGGEVVVHPLGTAGRAGCGARRGVSVEGEVPGRTRPSVREVEGLGGRGDELRLAMEAADNRLDDFGL